MVNAIELYEKLKLKLGGDAHLKTELQKEIGNLKTEVIKWMFLLWLGQIAVQL